LLSLKVESFFVQSTRIGPRPNLLEIGNPELIPRFSHPLGTKNESSAAQHQQASMLGSDIESSPPPMSEEEEETPALDLGLWAGTPDVHENITQSAGPTGTTRESGAKFTGRFLETATRNRNADCEGTGG